MPEWTRATPWRQGSLVSPSDLQAAGLELPASCGGGLVVTHDCDLSNDADVEPMVEFIPLEYIDNIDGNYEYARNPRTLHLAIEQQGVSRFIQLQATHKCALDKRFLAGCSPEPSSLSGLGLQVLQSWLAARYRRHAFPDELVERMRPLTGHLKSQLKKQARGVLGVWIDYDPKSAASADEPYELWLNIVYTLDVPGSDGQAEHLARELSRRFSDHLPGVVLAQCQAVSEEAFTLADQRRTVELKLEDLSHRIYPEGVVL